MTARLPFTEASLARAIRGVARAGRYVVAIRADGTLIVADKPLDAAALVPEDAPQERPSKWAD